MTFVLLKPWNGDSEGCWWHWDEEKMKLLNYRGGGFDIDEIFATSFGIYLPDGPGQTIRFRTDAKNAMYLRDLPIHHSQEEISSEGDSVTFSIFVCPDKALTMEFCKYGSRIEVLSPESVRKEVAEELRRASGLYDPE